MHITISYDGMMYFVCRTVDTDGTVLTKPFSNKEAAIRYVRGLFIEAENGLKKEGHES